MKQTLSASALKHEAFVLALLSGMTAADAARKVGYGRKNINVRIVAWELLQREDIQKRLREVAEATTDEAIMTVIQRKVRLSEMAREDDRPLECIDLLNRMDGLYSSKKPMSVQIAPITSVSVLQSARVKVAARIERTGSGAIESDDIGSLMVDGCSEASPMIEQIEDVPLPEEGSNNKNSEVIYGTRKPKGRSPTQIG